MALQRYEPPPALQLTDGTIQADALTHQEYEAFRDALPTWRDRLMAKVLRATGLRISEFLRLEVRHYSLAGPDFYLLVKRAKKRQKQGEYERIYLPPGLGVELRDYIRGNHLQEGQRVFPMTARNFGYICTRAGWKALGRPLHPHELRHLFVKTLIDGGVPVMAASKLVGHSDPKITQQWYYDLSTDQRRMIGERIPV